MYARVSTWLRRHGLPGSPQIFGRLILTGKTSDVSFAFAIGAILMVGGGLVEIVHSVKATQRAERHRHATYRGPKRHNTRPECDSLRPSSLVAS